MFVDPASDPREQGGPVQGERDTLVRQLRDRRLTLQLKCSGLDAAGMARRSVEPSNLSLLGLVRHLAAVELVQEGDDRAGRATAPPHGRRSGRRLRRRRARPRRGRGGLGYVASGGTAESASSAGFRGYWPYPYGTDQEIRDLVASVMTPRDRSATGRIVISLLCVNSVSELRALRS